WGNEKTTLGTTGFDPGNDFKEAVNLWCGNHGFKLPTPPSPPARKSKLYLVQPGDTLQKIALAFYGSQSAWMTIYSANLSVIGFDPSAHLSDIGSDPKVLVPGQVLTIPLPPEGPRCEGRMSG